MTHSPHKPVSPQRTTPASGPAGTGRLTGALHRVGLTTRGRRLVAGLGALALIAAAGITVAVRTGGDQPRAREYRDLTACLLTDSTGLRGQPAAAVWAGLQNASLATGTRVQYLTVAGPQTTENAGTFLGSLTQGSCDLLFAAGKAPVDATAADSARFPGVQHYLTPPAPAGARESTNLHLLTATGDALTSAVSDVVLTAADDAHR